MNAEELIQQAIKDKIILAYTEVKYINIDIGDMIKTYTRH
jgi:hypothetical protein